MERLSENSVISLAKQSRQGSPGSWVALLHVSLRDTDSVHLIALHSLRCCPQLKV